MLMAVVRQDFEKGVLKDWGCFLAESNGYAVWEGSEIDVMKTIKDNHNRSLVLFISLPVTY